MKKYSIINKTMNRKIFIPILIVVLLFVLFRNKVQAPTKEREVAITQESATHARIPKGWQTYTNDKTQFSISYPTDFEISDYGLNTQRIVKKVQTLGQGPSNFIYVSAILEGDQNKDGQIYNFNKTHLDSLVSMKVGDTKPVAGEEKELEQYVTFTRLPDIKIGGNKAMAFANMKPWEFPAGTKEYRYLIHQKNRTYIVGGYIATSETDEYSISETLYKKIIDTIQLPLPPQ